MTVWVIGVIALAVIGTFYFVSQLMRVPFKNVVLGIAGAIVGLLLGALISIPLGQLPAPYSNVLPLVVSLMLAVVMIGVFLSQSTLLANLMPVWMRGEGAGARPEAQPKVKASVHDPVLVDTSVIIDGRIADIARAGFVPGKLLVPRFVLAELQNIADSDDTIRRGRGRRGLEMLNDMQSIEGVEVEIIEHDLPDVREVDAKLVALAKQHGTNILTTDYNLNRVAQIEGVRVLNINELSNAIRPVVLPGEELVVKIVQAGKERNQGVGYLPDGTMIVVENGDKLIGQEVSAEVTRVFQTVAGKMIFATPRKTGHSNGTSNGNGNTTSQNQSKPGRRLFRGRGSKPSQSVTSEADAGPVPATPPPAEQKSRSNHRHESNDSIEERIIAESNRQS